MFSNVNEGGPIPSFTRQMIIKWGDTVLPLVAAFGHCSQETTSRTFLSFLYGMFPILYGSVTLSLIHFPCLTHLFIPSCLVISLLPLFFPCLSFPCSQTIIHPPFILSLFYPPAKVHFDLFLPKSYYAPFSPCTFITPYSVQIPPLTLLLL